MGYASGMIAAQMLALSLVLPVHQDGGQFYDEQCCSDRDCKPYPAEMVTTTPHGYVLADGRTVLHRDVKPSTDGRFHRCDLFGYLRCFYAPPPNM